MTYTTQSPSDADILEVVQHLGAAMLSPVEVARAVLARWGAQPAHAASVQEDAARLTAEQEHAIRQGHEIAASDGYFEARPQIDSNDRRKVFQAGFERGWDAARKQGANHD